MGSITYSHHENNEWILGLACFGGFRTTASTSQNLDLEDPKRVRIILLDHLPLGLSVSDFSQEGRLLTKPLAKIF